MTADQMPTSVLLASLALTIGIPVVVGCVMWGVLWAAGRVR